MIVSTLFYVVFVSGIGMLIYTMFGIRQLGYFANYLEKAIADTHRKRLTLIRDNENPNIVPDLDITASFRMFDKSWPWNYDFESMMVYKVAD
jgi:hypothetical protein